MSWTGPRLQRARAQKGWSRQELADAIGASLRSVAAWEREEATPQPQWVWKLDQIFDGETADPIISVADASLMELLAEIAARFARLESDRPDSGGRGPSTPSGRYRWKTADAPSAKRQRGASDNTPEPHLDDNNAGEG